MKLKKCMFFIYFITISVFYCTVMYVVFHPNTTRIYQLFFVENKTRFWKNGNGINYSLNNIISFQDVNNPYISKNGWDIPYSWGTCTKVKSTLPEVFFEIDNNTLPKSVSFTGYPFLNTPPQADISQKLTIYLNGKVLAIKPVSGAQNMHIEIPTDFISKFDGLIVLKFKYNGPSYSKKFLSKKIGYCFTDMQLQ